MNTNYAAIQTTGQSLEGRTITNITAVAPSEQNAVIREQKASIKSDGHHGVPETEDPASEPDLLPDFLSFGGPNDIIPSPTFGLRCVYDLFLPGVPPLLDPRELVLEARLRPPG
jgi:hypothetical protein